MLFDATLVANASPVGVVVEGDHQSELTVECEVKLGEVEELTVVEQLLFATRGGKSAKLGKYYV